MVLLLLCSDGQYAFLAYNFSRSSALFEQNSPYWLKLFMDQPFLLRRSSFVQSQLPIFKISFKLTTSFKAKTFIWNQLCIVKSLYLAVGLVYFFKRSVSIFFNRSVYIINSFLNCILRGYAYCAYDISWTNCRCREYTEISAYMNKLHHIACEIESLTSWLISWNFVYD